MRQAGFVLTGGRSRRMGRDKALLPYGGKKLLDAIAGQVREAAGSVILIGRPELYEHLGYTVYPDEVPERGPLGGICTALHWSQAEWNLIAACDLPFARAGDLRRLLEAADAADKTVDCVIPTAPDGRLQPLCAVYHGRCLSKVELALERNELKVLDLVAKLKIVRCTCLRPETFVNVNTPADWEKIEEWQTRR